MSSDEALAARYQTRSQLAANRQATRSSLLDRWQIDHKPNLEAIRKAALELLSAIEAQRETMYRAEEMASLDAYACDLATGALDMLNDLHSGYLREADEAALAHDMMPLDLLELQLVASKWKLRAEARRAS